MMHRASGNAGGDGAEEGLVIALLLLPMLPMLAMDAKSSKSWAIGMSWTEWALIH